MDTWIIGIDEAGRGSLLGRVYAGAVCIGSDPEKWTSDALRMEKIVVRDSKTMTKKAREHSRVYIEDKAMWGVGWASEDEVDRLGIVPANTLAMHRAIDELLLRHPILSEKKKELRVDGTFFTTYPDMKHELVVRGESVHIEIAAASILAKTHRDAYVKALCQANGCLTRYGLETNMGYGTASHLQALRDHGATPLHRQTFIKKFCPPLID